MSGRRGSVFKSPREGLVDGRSGWCMQLLPLRPALRPFALAQIEAAVAELVTAVKSRTSNVRNPFGMLVARARSGSTPTLQPAKADEPPTFESSSSESVIPLGVRSALKELSADALAALDSFIDGEIGSCTYRARAITDALRLECFEHWAKPGERRITPGTLWGHPRHTRGSRPIKIRAGNSELETAAEHGGGEGLEGEAVLFVPHFAGSSVGEHHAR